jgi:hypothetical protein
VALQSSHHLEDVALLNPRGRDPSRPDRTVMRGDYRRTADFRASATDPDPSLMRSRGGGLDLQYHDH